jgi:GNAT superfamily N-acetyltransferase
MTALDLSQVRVRPYEPRDRANVIAAEADLQEYERKLHDTRIPGDEAAEPTFRLLESLINANDGEIFVAEDGSGFLGYAAGFVLRDENPAETEDSNICGYINDVYVVPHRRGNGVASLLLQAVEDFLRAKGMERLRINTLVANDSAKRAYGKHGFEPYEVMMEKRLKQP